MSAISGDVKAKRPTVWGFDPGVATGWARWHFRDGRYVLDGSGVIPDFFGENADEALLALINEYEDQVDDGDVVAVEHLFCGGRGFSTKGIMAEGIIRRVAVEHGAEVVLVYPRALSSHRARWPFPRGSGFKIHTRDAIHHVIAYFEKMGWPYEFSFKKGV